MFVPTHTCTQRGFHRLPQPMAAFHKLPAASMRRLRVLHECPSILLAPALLSESECARLIAKAEPHLQPQSFDNPQGGVRTSHGCVIRDEEVPSLRSRFASLLGLECSSMLQPMKVSRYRSGERFDIHTDAIRGDLRGESPNPSDWWADKKREAHGVPGAPFSGCNRMVTIFVYLNSVNQGGRTRWRWTGHDPSFYTDPRPGHGRVDVDAGAGTEVAVAPEAGVGVVHFPATTPESGGLTDYNAFHDAEPPVECEKWILQQFVWSHRRLDWTRVLDEENWPPSERRSSDTI